MFWSCTEAMTCECKLPHGESIFKKAIKDCELIRPITLQRY